MIHPVDPICTGADNCCGRNGYKCGLGEGDCDRNSDCIGDLVCGKNNCVGDGFDPTDDCCVGMFDSIFSSLYTNKY